MLPRTNEKVHVEVILITSAQILSRGGVCEDYIESCRSSSSPESCYTTHSLVARMLELPLALSAPLSAQPPSLVAVDSCKVNLVNLPPVVCPVQEDIFNLPVDPIQPCPFKNKDVNKWTKEHQTTCEEDMKTRSASTVDELQEMVSVNIVDFELDISYL